jgi:predicted RNase H-like HicB family nuclease
MKELPVPYWSRVVSHRGIDLLNRALEKYRLGQSEPIFVGQIAEQQGLPKRIKASNMKAMKFMTTLERDEDGVWVAECPSIPGCVSQGKSREEALDNIREAIAACLEVRAERGMPLTIETQQVEVTV